MQETPLLFNAATQKVQWGLHRIGEFEWTLKQYELSNPVTLTNTGSAIIIERAKSPPEQLPLIIGDAIHNLRTALDLLATELARLNGQNEKGVYFPFANDAEALAEQIRQKKFDRAGEGAVRLLKDLRPYHGGDEVLRGLHDLDIMDKHRLMLPVFQAFQMRKFRLSGPNGELVADISGPGDGVSVSATAEDTATWEALHYLVVFDKNVPAVFVEQLVGPTLREIAGVVSHIIESFRALQRERT